MFSLPLRPDSRFESMFADATPGLARNPKLLNFPNVLADGSTSVIVYPAFFDITSGNMPDRYLRITQDPNGGFKIDLVNMAYINPQGEIVRTWPVSVNSGDLDYIIGEIWTQWFDYFADVSEL